MEFAIFNPPPQTECQEPETQEPETQGPWFLPTSTDEVGCVTLAIFSPDYTYYPLPEEPPSAIVRGEVLNGGNLLEAEIEYTGVPKPVGEPLSGMWRVISPQISMGDETGGSVGLVQRIE